MKEIFYGIVFVIVIGAINYALSSTIYYQTINGTKYVLKVDDKETFRLLTETDRQEGTLIEIK